MKKNVSIIIGIFIAVAIFSFSCEKMTDISKSEDIKTSNGQLLDNSKDQPHTLNLVILRAEIRRATKERPRDGKYCGCANCFGLCDFEWFPDLKKLFNSNSILMDTNKSTILINFIDQQHATVYLLERKFDTFLRNFPLKSER
jgi:hypothetical protein